MKKYPLIVGLGLVSSLFLSGCDSGVAVGETYNYGPYDNGWGWGDDWNYGWNQGWDYEWRNRNWHRDRPREEFRENRRAAIREHERARR